MFQVVMKHIFVWSFRFFNTVFEKEAIIIFSYKTFQAKFAVEKLDWLLFEDF